MGTALANACQLAQAHSTAARVSTTGFLATVETLRDSLSGRIAGGAASDVDELREACASAIGAGLMLPVLEAILRQLALSSTYDLDSAQRGSIQQVMLDLYDAFVTNSHHVKQRALVYGTPSAGGSNVGDGTCVRLTVDEDGQELQGWFADTLTLECVEDQHTTGQTLRETFRIRGTAESPDLLEFDGYGPSIDQSGIPVASAKATTLLKNPGFDQGTFSGTTITALTSWTAASSLSNYETNTTAAQIYLDTTASGGTSRSLKQTADDTIYQALVATAGARLPRDVPVLIGVRVYRASSATGNLTLRLSATATSGGLERTVTLASLTDDDWTTVYLVATPGANCWPTNFDLNALLFAIEIDTLAVGTVYFSDVIAVPFTRVGGLGTRAGRGGMGTYLACVSGQVPFLRGDSFQIVDTEVEADRGEIAYWLASYQLGYLPSVDPATEVTAAGGRTFTFADADPDTITLSSGDLTTEGYEAGMQLTVAGTSSNDGTYEIASVTATVITLVAGAALAAEGPLSSTATLNAGPHYPDS